MCDVNRLFANIALICFASNIFCRYVIHKIPFSSHVQKIVNNAIYEEYYQMLQSMYTVAYIERQSFQNWRLREISLCIAVV